MRIGIDLDEVLCEFVQGLIKFHNFKYGSNLVFEDFFSFSFEKVWGGSFEEVLVKIGEYHESSFFLNIVPVNGAIDSVNELRKTHDLFIITARWHSVRDKTLTWLNKYFDGAFKDVVFVNHWAKEGGEKSKGDVCDELDLDLFIDDFAPYAVDCYRKRKSGSFRKVILFNKPWNKNEELPRGIIRVNSWAECVHSINSLN